MALFSNEVSDAVKRLAAKTYASQEERDELLGRVESADGVRARDVVWMLFRPDRALRDTATRVLTKIRDVETLDLFLGESKGKPEQAMRAAAVSLFSFGLPGLETRFAQLLAPPVKETKETRELQEAARRLIAEAPLTRQLEPLLWQLATTGNGDDRLPFLNRLATSEIDENAAKRWRRVATDTNPAVRDKAIEVLATRAPQQSIDLLIEALPQAGYAVQQIIVEAMTRAAAGQGVAFADKLLPALASGDASTRTAVLKILLGIGDPAGVIKRYIRFSSTLAGFVRDRALESLRDFGAALIEPVIELLHDPDPDTRSGAMAVAGVFDDVRIVPATIELLSDPDWWIRISAADTLGRLKDPRAVEPLVAASRRCRPEVGRRRSARAHRRPARLAGPRPDAGRSGTRRSDRSDAGAEELQASPGAQRSDQRGPERSRSRRAHARDRDSRRVGSDRQERAAAGRRCPQGGAHGIGGAG